LERLEERSLLSTYSLWDPTTVPASPQNPDLQSVELGVRFQSDVPGTLTGIRFYKVAANAGPHVVNLWSASGDLLATATTVNETDTGWQEADFSSPFSIAANTVYVASYHAAFGSYAADNYFFSSDGVENGPLHAPFSAGVYSYGDMPSFPDQTWKSTNYWVDVALTPTMDLVVNAGNPQNVSQYDSVTFSGSATGGVGPFTYSWDFGDGSSATGTLTPTHVYVNSGTFFPTLTVTDSLGQTETSATTVNVNKVVLPVSAGGSYLSSPSVAIQFAGSVAGDGNSDQSGYSYLWSFGDGFISTLPNPTHAYDHPGTYLVSLRVTAPNGLAGTDNTTATVSVSSVPLLHENNLQYVGAFRLPSGPIGSSTFDYGGTALAFNPSNNSLFLVGHDWDQEVAEVAIPSNVVNSTRVTDLPTAAVLQPFVNVLGEVPNMTLTNTVKIGGLMVDNGQLIGTAYEYYDGLENAVESHFRVDSLDLASAQVEGLFQVGSYGGGAVGGWMAPIPSEWQAALGAPYVTGQGAIPVIGRTSSGPAVFGFDPSQLGTGITPVTPYVYYPLTNPLANIVTNNPLFNGNTEIKGMAFVPGTRTILFFGDNGTNSVGYGEAADFNDGYRTGKGWHSQNGDYAYEVWAYNVEDLIAAKNGQIQPWQVKPYETWNFDLPTFDGGKHIGGVAFDPATMRLYVSQQGGDTTDGGYMPLIQVFQLALNLQGAGQQIGGATATLNVGDVGGQLTLPEGGALTLTANNVRTSTVSSNIAQVLFYLDVNGDGNLETDQDLLLGAGTQDGTTWTLNVSTALLPPSPSLANLPAGTYRIFAEAQDSDGLFSDPAEIVVTVL
jgi:PKD repeat protein